MGPKSPQSRLEICILGGLNGFERSLFFCKADIRERRYRLSPNDCFRPYADGYPASTMKSIAVYIAAALSEIAGCFAFWAWLRLERSPVWLIPGVVSLALFGFLLTRVDAAFAGRAFAAYGGVYIAASLVWMFAVERMQPDRWDYVGAAICLVGAGIILYGPR